MSIVFLNINARGYLKSKSLEQGSMKSISYMWNHWNDYESLITRYVQKTKLFLFYRDCFQRGKISVARVDLFWILKNHNNFTGNWYYLNPRKANESLAFLLLSSGLDISMTLLVISITEFWETRMKARVFYLYPLCSIFECLCW